ncbi:hypothetical protein [Tolypothrix sp. VBCCA 56010]
MKSVLSLKLACLVFNLQSVLETISNINHQMVAASDQSAIAS